MNHYKHTKALTSYARSNRKVQTDAEKLLWYQLRGRNLNGYKFRRQFPILNYILDFYCEETRVAIELDGSQHMEKNQYDEKRSSELNKEGIHILRFWNTDIFKNIDVVLEEILNACQVRRPHPTLS